MTWVATLAGRNTSTLGESVHHSAPSLSSPHIFPSSSSSSSRTGQEEGGAAKVLFPIFPSSPLLGPRLTLGHSVLSPIVAGINCYQLWNNGTRHKL